MLEPKKSYEHKTRPQKFQMASNVTPKVSFLSTWMDMPLATSQKVLNKIFQPKKGNTKFLIQKKVLRSQISNLVIIIPEYTPGRTALYLLKDAQLGVRASGRFVIEEGSKTISILHFLSIFLCNMICFSVTYISV